jgi:cephalosporin hydroxylase
MELRIRIKWLPKNMYSKLNYKSPPRKTIQDHGAIMRDLDLWVSRHGMGIYVAEDFIPVVFHGLDHGIQQVRNEISEFIRILLCKGLDNTVLEIGLGTHGGTHLLWRNIFKRVVTIEMNLAESQRIRLNEQLDHRSTIVVGKSQDHSTLEKVKAHMDSVDVLFIDGKHDHESVAEDWAMYHELVRPGGIVAFHDSLCTLPGFGVAKFLEELSQGLIDNKCHTLHQIAYSDHTGISFEVC